MKINIKRLFPQGILFIAVFFVSCARVADRNMPVYVDQEGIMRWSETGKEAAFFGVNYSTPFAYAYRAHTRLGVDIEKAIDEDVYHMARLGINAFRIHMWDTEISDSMGNLLENEHLRLFDYLLSKLREREIYTLMTPIAFWGNGWPEKNESTPGFSHVYGRDHAATHPKAVAAQERYLQQLLAHTNPYTGLRYGDDPYIIGAEVNNEPVHRGSASEVTGYINRMVKAMRDAEWTKPIFYNISQNPGYAEAVVAANVDGFTFQWYPLGLVANHTRRGNFLPHVDHYHIPFDTIPGFANKAKLVYEFDPADQLQPIYLPAMARSFRQAGFQWATQFAYDPLAIAYSNSEYPTHYLNLAYTPERAISLLIAGVVFRETPRHQAFEAYPANTVFGNLRLDYQQQLSERNTSTHFFHTGNTTAAPVAVTQLQQVAGTGSSPIAQYTGSGAYFLDRLEPGIWRLEVMPDVHYLRDPFGIQQPGDTVATLSWQEHAFQLSLPDLAGDYRFEGLNDGNNRMGKAVEGKVWITPGTYLLLREGQQFSEKAVEGNIWITPGTHLLLREGQQAPEAEAGMFAAKVGLREFAAPAAIAEDFPTWRPTTKTPGTGVLFDGGKGADIQCYPNWHVAVEPSYPEGKRPYFSIAYNPVKANSPAIKPEMLAMQLTLDGNIHEETSRLHTLKLRAKSVQDNVSIYVGLVSIDGQTHGKEIRLKADYDTYDVPLDELHPHATVLLPRPYPDFQPLWFSPAKAPAFKLENVERIQLVMALDSVADAGLKGFEVDSIWIE